MFDVDTPVPTVVGDEVDVAGMGEDEGNWLSGAAEDGTDVGDVSVLLFSGDIWRQNEAYEFLSRKSFTYIVGIYRLQGFL